MKSGTGDAPVRRRLLLHPQETIAQNTSPPSCPYSVGSRPPNGFDTGNEDEVMSLPIEKRTAMLRATSASGCTPSGSRRQRPETTEGNNFHEVTAPLSPTSIRPPPSTPLTAVALEEAVPCRLTRGGPNGERHFVVPSLMRSTSLLVHSEAIAKMTQMHSCSSPPSLSNPSGNRVALVSLIGGSRYSVAAKHSSGEGEVDGCTGPSTSVVDVGCFSVPPPPPPNRSTPAQFSRSEKSLWIATRNPNEGIVAADCNECTTCTGEGSKELLSPCAPDGVLPVGVEPDAGQPHTMRIEYISTTLDQGDKSNSTTTGGGGGAVAVADQCSHFDEAVKKAVPPLKQKDVVVPQNDSPLPASLVLHRADIAIGCEQERHTAALTASFDSSRGSATAEATPPQTRWGEEVSSNMSSQRRSNIASSATPQGQAVFAAENALHLETTTPNKVQGATRPQPQGGSLHEQDNSIAVDDYLSTVGKRDFRKHGSPSSGRAAGSSYGCSDGGSILESHQACHLTLDSHADMEDDAHGSVASLNNNIESLAQDTQESAQQHHARSAEGVVALSGVGGVGPLVSEYPISLTCQEIPSTRPSDTHADETVDLQDDDMKPVLERSNATLAEFSTRTLTAFMTGCQVAWLPPIALTGLPRGVPPMQTPPLAAAEASATGDSSEMSLLFRLYCRSPSERSAERLVEIFFDTQRMRYVNWVNHLCFEHLYVHMVALRAVSMLEVHHRRLTCMLRDLCIRDTIELFMLLLPRPRAPKASSRRGIFSRFRIALHALGGDSRKREVSIATNKCQGGCHVGRQPQPSSSAAPPSAPLCRLTAVEDKDKCEPLRVEPLFASEHCYPVHSTARVFKAGSCVTDGRKTSGVGAPVSSPTGGASHTDAEVLRVVPDTNNSEHSIQDTCVSRRGIPRPLNRVYRDYHLLAAKKARRSSAPSTVSSATSWLPRLGRKTSEKASGIIPNTTARSEIYCVTCCDGCCTPSSQHLLDHGRARQEHANKVLIDGEQSVEECILPHKCNRSTQLTAMEMANPNFLNLFDADALEKFAP